MKKSRYNCTWQPMTPEKPDGYIVNRHVYTRNLRNQLLKLYKEKLNNKQTYENKI